MIIGKLLNPKLDYVFKTLKKEYCTIGVKCIQEI